MENAEEILHFLEEFTKRKTRTIPQELNEYLAHVARTGDPVYQWSLVKSLFKEKLLNVITDFYETTPGIDIPPYPNVDPFNYDTMKNSLLERLDSFTAAPFTVQRICELLTYPRKQYNRIDKFMRAIEKNILVVSTREPGLQRHNIEPDIGESVEPIVNGSDNNSEYNVDVEMEDMSWKENTGQQQNAGPQPGSSEAHISVDDAETHLQNKEDVAVSSQEKTSEYESLTPPESNNEAVVETKVSEEKANELTTTTSISTAEENEKIETPCTEIPQEEEMKDKLVISNIVIPEIKIDDSEMTEQKLSEQSFKAMNVIDKPEEHQTIDEDTKISDEKAPTEANQTPNIIDENSTDSNSKEEPEQKLFSEISTSSEESSSSSDNIDGNSNSPKTDSETQVEIQAEQSQPSSNSDSQESVESTKQLDDEKESDNTSRIEENNSSQIVMQSDNYSISDVNSILPQMPLKLDTESSKSTLENENDKLIENENSNDEKTESIDVSNNKET